MILGCYRCLDMLCRTPCNSTDAHLAKIYDSRIFTVVISKRLICDQQINEIPHIRRGNMDGQNRIKNLIYITPSQHALFLPKPPICPRYHQSKEPTTALRVALRLGNERATIAPTNTGAQGAMPIKSKYLFVAS